MDNKTVKVRILVAITQAGKYAAVGAFDPTERDTDQDIEKGIPELMEGEGYYTLTWVTVELPIPAIPTVNI